MEILIFLAPMLLLLWLISSRGRKKQQAQQEQLLNSLAPGTWVMTRAGFFGKVVEVDGKVVTLESPTGELSIWLDAAIAEVKDPPFADDGEEDAEAEDGEVAPSAGLSADSAATAGPDGFRPGGPTVGRDGRLTDRDKG